MRERQLTGNHMCLLKRQSPTSVTHLLQQGLTSQSFAKSSASDQMLQQFEQQTNQTRNIRL